MAKVLPHNLEVEQAILGCVFLDNKLATNLLDRCVSTDFFDERNQLIFSAMKISRENGRNIDFTTLNMELINQSKSEASGGLDYLIELSDAVPSTANFDSYIDILLDLSLKREMINTVGKLIDDGYDGKLTSTEYVDKVEGKIFEVAKRRKTSDFSRISEITEEVKEKAEASMKCAGNITGLATGFTELDRITSGFHPQELIILAARPSMGKSAFAMNLALNVAKRNKNGLATVAVFSLEMSNDQLVSRMISAEAHVEQGNIKSGKLTSQDWEFINNANAKLQKLNIYFDDSAGITIGDIRAKCRKLAQSGGLDMVVIDYLQLITGDQKTTNRQEEVAKISRGLKQMARELNIPIIALSQLSRDVEKSDDKIPNMSHLRESGSIEQDADIVMFLYRDDYYHKNSPRKGEADLIISKNRSGAAGITIPFIFQPAFSTFRNMANGEYTDNLEND